MKGNAMNTLAILFAVYIFGLVWWWRNYLFYLAWSGHNRLTPQSAEREHSPPTPGRTDAKPTLAAPSQGKVLGLLAATIWLTGNALAAQPPRASERSVPTTEATAAIQMPSDRRAGKTAAPTKPAPTTPVRLPDPAELPRVGTGLVKNGEPQHLRLRHEPFHNQWVANMPARN